jgi:glycosyltransferase involved in cell wall biosynthesis
MRDPRIVVTGYVENTSPYLADCSAFIVPLRAGGGMRVKILDGWSAGLPIVTTSLGCEGIRVIHGNTLLVADSAEAFASSVLTLLTKPTLAQSLGRQGRAWVSSHYDWRKVYPAFDAIYPPI